MGGMPIFKFISLLLWQGWENQTKNNRNFKILFSDDFVGVKTSKRLNCDRHANQHYKQIGKKGH